jgi:hypothetical protein
MRKSAACSAGPPRVPCPPPSTRTAEPHGRGHPVRLVPASILEPLHDHGPVKLEEHAGHLAHGGTHRVSRVILVDLPGLHLEDREEG